MKKIRELQWLTGTKYLMESIDDYDWESFIKNYKQVDEKFLLTINDISYNKQLDALSRNFGSRHLTLLFELKGLSISVKNEAVLKDIMIDGKPFASYDFELSSLVNNLNKYFSYFNSQSGTLLFLEIAKRKFNFESFFDLPKNKFIEFTLWYLDSIENYIKTTSLTEIDFKNYTSNLINFAKELSDSVNKLPIDNKSVVQLNGKVLINSVISSGTEYQKLFKNAELYKASLNKELLDAEYIRKHTKEENGN